MKHRERVLTTLEHKEADRVPLDCGSVGSLIVDGVYFKIKDILGIKKNIEPYRSGSTANYYDERILEEFDIDFRHLWLASKDKPKPMKNPDGTVTDEWNITWSREGSYPSIFPLKNATLEEIENFKWPFPDKNWDVSQLVQRAENLYKNTDYAIVAKAVMSGGGLLERSYYLRSIDDLFVDMSINKEVAHYIIDKVTEIEIALWDIYLKAIGPYVHIIQRASDLGTQLGLFISPKMYIEFLKPAEIKIISHIKKLAPKAKIWFHSCGAITELIDDFIDIGIDILNPVQPLAKGMDSFMLKKRYGKKLVFHGGIDLQKALPGSIEDVKKEVETRIKAFGPGGGYILAPANHIQSDTPPENVIFLYEYAKEYGKYPLKT